MSRVDININKIIVIGNEYDFYTNFKSLVDSVFCCSNDVLQIYCNLKEIPEELIAFIKTLHLKDVDKRLELIDKGNLETRIYEYKRDK